MKTAANLTFFELIRSFLEYADIHGVKSFPSMLHERSSWNQFLWKIRDTTEIASIIGGFDWDGEHPKNRLFEDFAATANFSYFAHSSIDGRLVLDNIRPANPLIASCCGLLEKMFSIANQIPDFFEIP